MPHDPNQLRAQLDDPNNWKMAAVPKPDKAFGATAPVMEALRRLYEGSDVAKRGLTDFASRAYNNPATRDLISEMEQAAGNAGREGPGTYIKGAKQALQGLRESGRQGQMVADEMNNWTIEKLFPLFFGQ